MARRERRGTPPPPDELRCSRSDGKMWRCKNWKMEDRSVCEAHYQRQVRRGGVRVSSPDGKRGGGRNRQRKISDDKTFWPPAAAIGGMTAGRDIQMMEIRPMKPMQVDDSGSDDEEEEEEEEEENSLAKGDEEEDEEEEVLKVRMKRRRKHLKEGRKGRKAPKRDLEAGPSSVARVTRNPNKVSGHKKNPKGSQRRRLTGEDALMCHQCQRNDKGRVVWCLKCKKKCFCVPCMTRRYPHLSEAEFAKACPVCCNNCNCKACLRKKGVSKPEEKEINGADRVQYNCHIVRSLLPWLKELQQEQMTEKEIEAKIQGLALTDIKLKRVNCRKDE